MYNKGQIVFSKAGHDKGDCFIVIDCDEKFAVLADGKRRLLNKPKKKKYIHIQPTNSVDENIKNKLEQGEYVIDADIRKALSKYVRA